MMGLSEVARATQTPDLSIQHRHSPRLLLCRRANLAAGLGEGPSQHGASHCPSASRGWAGSAAWDFGQDSSRTSSLCPGTLHRPALSPPQRACGPQPLLCVGPWGTEPYTSPCGHPFSALTVSTSGKAALYTPTASCPHPHPAPRWGFSSLVGEEQVVHSLPAPPLGASWGTALEAPPCHAPVLRVSFLWRLLAGWLGPSCPWPPSFYLCWCLQFGVGSLGRQLRPVLAEWCCVSLCGWTRLSLAPPRTL